MLSPVVVFVYARPEHTEKTIESLALNELADETEVYIYSDAPKSSAVRERVEMVRSYIDRLPQRNLFKSVKIIKSDFNKGLAQSVISGVTDVVQEHGKVIVVEDDLISSPDFLKYMNSAVDHFQEDQRIWSISGYTFDIQAPQDYTHDIYLSYRGCSWGWATWKNRWEKVDWTVADYPSFKNNRLLRSRLNRGGRDMSFMLDAQMIGKIDSWAIRWCYSQSKLDMLTVYPIVSRIQNIGLDGSGTHSGKSTGYDAMLSAEAKDCRFERIEIDKRISYSFREKFGSKSEYLKMEAIRYIKRILVKCG